MHLFSLALGIVKHAEWAEEVLQDAFINVWLNADKFRPDKSGAMTWISGGPGFQKVLNSLAVVLGCSD